MENGSTHQDDVQGSTNAAGAGRTGAALAYTYDAVNNITDIANAVDNTRSQTLDYDLLNRLLDATGNYGDIDYAYDAIGNRLSETIDTVAETYSFDVTSHHLTQTVNRIKDLIAAAGEVCNANPDMPAAKAFHTQ